MIDVKELGRPAALVAGLAAVAAVGFGAGVVVGRDPQRLRDLLRAAAGGLERVRFALAETREEVTDLWAEVREEARANVESAAFAAAATPQQSEPGAAAGDDAAHATPAHAVPASSAPRSKRTGKPRRAAGAARRARAPRSP